MSFVQKEPLVGEVELIGARLNQARMTANLALQDIADRTKISLRFLVSKITLSSLLRFFVLNSS